ncbi:hypothetical protein [Buttiauxella sp.]
MMEDQTLIYRYDVYGNLVGGSNPQRLYLSIRMQSQHYDDESDIHYKR